MAAGDDEPVSDDAIQAAVAAAAAADEVTEEDIWALCDAFPNLVHLLLNGHSDGSNLSRLMKPYRQVKLAPTSSPENGGEAKAPSPTNGEAGDSGNADDVEEKEVSLPVMAYAPHVDHVIKRVMRAAEGVPGAQVRAFGSSVNGCGEKSSDVDLVLAAAKKSLVQGLDLGRVSRQDLPARVLGKMQRRLQKQGFTVNERVLGAKVPILKLSIKYNGGFTECDLSVNNLLPVFNTKLLKTYADLHPRLVELIHACKAWAREEKVHGAALGHLSSYSFSLMVIFYMQIRGALPCLQQNASKHPVFYSDGNKTYNVFMVDSSDHSVTPETDKSIGFSDFVRFYHDEFKWGESVVSVRTGQICSKDAYPNLKMKPRSEITPEQWKYFIHIEDPFDIERNLNCVLGPASNDKLWWKFVEAGEKHSGGSGKTNQERSGRQGPRRRWAPGAEVRGGTGAQQRRDAWGLAAWLAGSHPKHLHHDPPKDDF